MCSVQRLTPRYLLRHLHLDHQDTRAAHRPNTFLTFRTPHHQAQAVSVARPAYSRKCSNVAYRHPYLAQLRHHQVWGSAQFQRELPSSVQKRDHVQFVVVINIIPNTSLLDESATIKDGKNTLLPPSTNHIAADQSRREKHINARRLYPSTQNDQQAVLANHPALVEGIYRLKSQEM